MGKVGVSSFCCARRELMRVEKSVSVHFVAPGEN
jgi:hypothetical protein